jgi:hypothetical protein
MQQPEGVADNLRMSLDAEPHTDVPHLILISI